MTSTGPLTPAYTAPAIATRLPVTGIVGGIKSDPGVIISAHFEK